MQIFLSAFDDVLDPRASNAHHDLGELLVITSHDTFSKVFRVIDSKTLDATFGKVLADVATLLKDGIGIADKALRGA